MIHGDIQAHFSLLDVTADDELNKTPQNREYQSGKPITVASVLDNLQLMSRAHPEDHGVDVKQLANRLRALNRQWSAGQYEAEDETTKILKLAEAHELCYEISQNCWRPGSRPKRLTTVLGPAPAHISEGTSERRFVLHEEEQKIHVVEKPALKSGRLKLLNFLKSLLHIASSSPEVDEAKPSDDQGKDAIMISKTEPKTLHYMETTRSRSSNVNRLHEPTTNIPDAKSEQKRFSNVTHSENMTTIKERKYPTEYTRNPPTVNSYCQEFYERESSQKREKSHKNGARHNRKALQRRTITDLLDRSNFGESHKQDKWARSEKSSRMIKTRSCRYGKSRSNRRDHKMTSKKERQERSHRHAHCEDEEETGKHPSSRSKRKSHKQSRKHHSNRKTMRESRSKDEDRNETTNGEQKAGRSSLYWQMAELAPPESFRGDNEDDDDGRGVRRKNSRRRSSRRKFDRKSNKKKSLCKPCRREMRHSVKWNLVQILCKLLNKEEKRSGRKHCVCEKCLGLRDGQSKDCRFAKRVDVEDDEKENCARHSTTLSRYLATK